MSVPSGSVQESSVSSTTEEVDNVNPSASAESGNSVVSKTPVSPAHSANHQEHKEKHLNPSAKVFTPTTSAVPFTFVPSDVTPSIPPSASTLSVSSTTSSTGSNPAVTLSKPKLRATAKAFVPGQFQAPVTNSALASGTPSPAAGQGLPSDPALASSVVSTSPDPHISANPGTPLMNGVHLSVSTDNSHPAGATSSIPTLPLPSPAGFPNYSGSGSSSIAAKAAESQAEADLTSTLQRQKKYSRNELLAYRKYFTEKPKGLISSPELEMLFQKSLQPPGSSPTLKRGLSDSASRFASAMKSPGGVAAGRKGGVRFDDAPASSPLKRQSSAPTPSKRTPKSKKGEGKAGRNGKVDAPMDIEIAPLEMSENRYIPVALVADIAASSNATGDGEGAAKEAKFKALSVALSDSDKLRRSVTSILNKLTPEKFERLVGRVLELDITSLQALNDVVTGIFEKALAEPNFSPTYAEFCVKLSPELPTFTTTTTVSTDPSTTPSTTATDPSGNESSTAQPTQHQEVATFKRLLLKRCQTEFEQKEDPTVKAKLDLLQGAEREEEERKAKRRVLGTIRFIGELFGRNMLSAAIMTECIAILLGDVNNPQEEDIEALCKLLTTAGKQMDTKMQEFMDTCFRSLSDLSQPSTKLDSRLRFMIQDVIDLRARSWIPRRQEVVAKKLSELHQEHSQTTTTLPAKGKSVPAGSPPSRKGTSKSTPTTPYSSKTKGSPVPDDEWETVGSKGTPAGKWKRSGGVGSQDVRVSRTPSGKRPPSSGAAPFLTPKGKSSASQPPATAPAKSSKARPSARTPSGKGANKEAGEEEQPRKPLNAFSLLNDDEEAPEEEAEEEQPEEEEEEEEERESRSGSEQEQEEEEADTEPSAAPPAPKRKDSFDLDSFTEADLLGPSKKEKKEKAGKGKGKKGKAAAKSKSNNKLAAGKSERKEEKKSAAVTSESKTKSLERPMERHASISGSSTGSGAAETFDDEVKEDRSRRDRDGDQDDQDADSAVDKTTRKIRSLLTEFFSSRDFKEARLCVQELDSADDHHTLVLEALAMAVERNDAERDLIGQLFVDLHQKNILSTEHVEQGFAEIFELVEDLIVDVPRTVEHLAAILSHLAIARAVRLQFLQDEAITPLKDSGRAATLVACVLSNIQKSSGEAVMTELIDGIQFKWPSLMKKSERDNNEAVVKLLESKGLNASRLISQS